MVDRDKLANYCAQSVSVLHPQVLYMSGGLRAWVYEGEIEVVKRHRRARDACCGKNSWMKCLREGNTDQDTYRGERFCVRWIKKECN